MSVNYARLCFAYLGAVSIIRGPVGLKHFSPEALRDRSVLDLAKKISVKSDGSSDPAAFTPQRAEAVLIDGRTIVAETDALYGSPAFPMSQDNIASKRAECLEFGFGAPRPDLDAALVATVETLDAAASAAELAHLASGAQAP